MKTLKTIAKTFFIAGILALLNSCSKDSTTNNVPVSPNNSFVKGKVDGASYSSLVASCSRVGSGTTAAITILGGDATGNSITLLMVGIAAPGTYTVNGTANSVLSYLPASGGVAYSTECSAASGTVTVTSVDATHIQGTFSFVGKDSENCDTGATKNITEGSFKGIF